MGGMGVCVCVWVCSASQHQACSWAACLLPYIPAAAEQQESLQHQERRAQATIAAVWLSATRTALDGSHLGSHSGHAGRSENPCWEVVVEHETGVVEEAAEGVVDRWRFFSAGFFALVGSHDALYWLKFVKSFD